MNNELYFFEKLSFYICCLFSVLIPLPIFIDGLSGGLVLQQNSFPTIYEFPIPIGLLAFTFIFFIFYVNCLLFKRKYRLLVSDGRNRLVLSFISVFILFWSVFVANNDVFRVIQLILPLVLLLLVAFPVNKNRVKVLACFYFGGFFLFNFTHIISIFLNNIIIFDVREHDYALYWGYGIYQAFVSYPGVLGMFFALISFLIFIENNILSKLLLLFFWFFLVLSLGLSARRISLFEMGFTVSMILFFIFSHIFVNRGKINKNYFYSLGLFGCCLGFVLTFYFKMPIFVRAVDSAKADTFDSGRFDIYSRALDFFSSDYYFLIFGYGGKSGFHNYFLDIVFSVGLFPFLISFFVFIFFFKKSFVLSAKEISSYLFIALMGCFLLQSMLNASITQPLYLCNFIMIMLIAVFYTDFNEKFDSELSK